MFFSRRRTIQFLFTASVTLIGLNPAFAIDGPSFDCSRGVRQTLAVVLCTSREAAQADWNLNRAYWALFTDDKEETSFNEAVNQRCALPRLEMTSMGQPLTERHVMCVVNAFENRASALRNRLTGDARVESNLSPEEHIEIQVALARKGFLQNRNRSYGANADGQFGPNTRTAIKDFQLSIGAQPSGFLSNEQRLALLESPEEREARVVRVAAQEKAKQEALEAQRRAEEQAKQAAIEQEKKRLEAEEQAKQFAIEREKKRLEDEAAKAAEWRQKIDEAQKKGAEYASVTDLKWSLRERTNPMTDGQDYTVSSTQTNGAGATAVVEGICSKDQVVFEATLHDANDPKVPLGFSKSSEGGIIGNKRINDYSHFAASFPFNKWSNRIVISRQSFRQDDPESADVTWRVLAEIETSLGTLYIRLPMLDAKIQKLIAACKYHSEVEKRKLRAFNTSG